MTLHECSFPSTTITNQNKFELNLGFSLGSHRDVTSRSVSAPVWLRAGKMAEAQFKKICFQLQIHIFFCSIAIPLLPVNMKHNSKQNLDKLIEITN